MWERACSRRLTNIQHKCRLLCRLREQARSHIRPVFAQTIVASLKPAATYAQTLPPHPDPAAQRPTPQSAH
ncbi:hypothetical protein C5612_03180 [Pseudomonas frederiksbergensis]|uniref:Uncharacterized protein n=1 Tax=Pseudomonas frederiksbergensis TaxID=104087 RepID=A0A2S8HSY2_9PSED|nr:hypothetical protein C5612_03180 [Pseudomonas frederiksbergensis]